MDPTRQGPGEGQTETLGGHPRPARSRAGTDKVAVGGRQAAAWLPSLRFRVGFRGRGYPSRSNT